MESEVARLNRTQNKPGVAAQLSLSEADLARLIEVQVKTALEDFRDGNDRDFMTSGLMVGVTSPTISEDSAIFLAIATEFGVTTATRWSQYRAGGFGRAWLEGVDQQATAAGAPLSESQRAKVVNTVSEEYRRTNARRPGQQYGSTGAPQTASEQLAALEYAAHISAIDQQQLVLLLSGFLSEPQMEIVRQRAKQLADMYAAPIERLRNDPSSFRSPTPDSNGC
jgi:hypothetical protein